MDSSDYQPAVHIGDLSGSDSGKDSLPYLFTFICFFEKNIVIDLSKTRKRRCY